MCHMNALQFSIVFLPEYPFWNTSALPATHQGDAQRVKDSEVVGVGNGCTCSSFEENAGGVQQKEVFRG